MLVVAALLVALVVGLVVRNLGGDDAAGGGVDTSTPTVSAWDETSTPSATPSSPSPSGVTTVACPPGVDPGEPGDVVNGQIRASGLQAPVPDGFDSTYRMVPWLTGTAQVWKRIGDTTWVHTVTLGRLPAGTKLGDVQQSAKALMDCWTSSDRYPGRQSRTDLEAQAVTVDGRPGYWMRADVTVKDSDNPTIRGGRVDVIVIDTGNAAGYSVWHSAVHLGDEQVQKLVDESRAALKVTG